MAVTIVLTKDATKDLDGSVNKKLGPFLKKLQDDPTSPGLHIEPVKNAVDAKVRTGRVDQFWRAVLFRLEDGDDMVFVVRGVYAHDDAYVEAARTRYRVNLVSGVPEFIVVDPDPTDPVPTPVTPVLPVPTDSLLAAYGISRDDLVDSLGFEPDFADLAMTARSDSDIEVAMGRATQEWQALALVDLAAGMSVTEVKAGYQLKPVEDRDPESSETLIDALTTPAAKLTFAWIDNTEELRRAVEEGTFGAWRLFLHPAQRAFVDRDFNGPARITGGAGTGKTVVVLHRARRLAQRTGARVVVTTYTRNLADMLAQDLQRLDPTLRLVKRPGEEGVCVSGVDSLARQIVMSAEPELFEQAAELVLGRSTPKRKAMSKGEDWADAIDLVGAALPEPLRNVHFLEDEYSLVVLPHRVVDEAGYLKVRRPGRGVALDRARRKAVWRAVAAYRAQTRANQTFDFHETCALAAAYLDLLAARDRGRLADHVLVDEGQDMAPTRWQLLRALVAEGPDDLFIAEDSHQRIYGTRITLSHYGIAVRGRSRRLTLNYRTTAETLHWAMRVLDGDSFIGMDDDAEDHHGYRSARRGPEPQLVEASSFDDEIARCAETVKGWLAEDGVEPESCAVLARSGQLLERVVSGLNAAGLQIRAMTGDQVRPGAPVALTMHRSKGMEFSRVYLFGVREGSMPAGVKDHSYDDAAAEDARRRERSLLYVSATRARDALVVSWNGKPSSLLPD